MNHVLYIAAVCQIRHDTPGRAYYRRKLAEGKTPLEALRCLRRRLSDVVYRQLVADAATANQDGQEQAGPGGHSGATLTSSAADLTPVIGSSDKPQPGPASANLRASTASANPHRLPGSRRPAPTRPMSSTWSIPRLNDVDADQASAQPP